MRYRLGDLEARGEWAPSSESSAAVDLFENALMEEAIDSFFLEAIESAPQEWRPQVQELVR